MWCEFTHYHFIFKKLIFITFNKNVLYLQMCKYKNILGIPNTGFHKHTYGIAINDVIGTIIIAYLWISIRDKKINVDLCELVKAFCVVFLVGEILHVMFCVDTQFIKFLTKC